MPKMGDRLADDEQKQFVGRTGVLADFDQFLSSGDSMIFAVIGIGGIGKSSLLHQAAIRARSHGWIALTSDLNLTSTPVDWLDSVATQWESNGLAANNYRRIQTEVRRLSVIARESFREEEHSTGQPLSKDAQSEIVRSILLPNEAELYLHGRRELSRGLAEDLIADPELRVLIAIDTFEKASQSFHLWLTTELLPELDDTQRLLIAGQRALDVGWEKWHSLTRTVELSNFSEDELRELIEKCAPNSGQDERQLLQSTGGYPLAATLMVKTIQPGLDPGTVATAFRDQSIGRIFRSLPNPQLRELVEATAGFPLVTLDVLSRSTGHRVPSELWREMRDLPFVRRSDLGLQVHDVVQRYLIEEAIESSPAEFTQRHLAAAEYWRSIDNLPLYVHHLCVADPAQAVRIIRNIVRFAHAAGDVHQVDAITSQLEASSHLFPAHGTVALLTAAYVETLDGDWEGASSMLSVGIPDDSVTSGLVTLRLELDLFRCEVSRYLGDLINATTTAEDGMTRARNSRRSQTSDNHVDELVAAELNAQLVELYGLRGMMQEAEVRADELARLDTEGELGDEFVARLQLFHREHLARWRGQWTEALQALVRVAEFDVSSDRYGQCRLLYGVGRVFTYIGWFTAATTMLSAAEAGFSESRRKQQQGEALVGLSIIKRECGFHEDSLNYLDQALGLFDAGGSSLYGCWVRANEYRTLAGSTPTIIDESELQEFHNRCERMQYRHGEGHALFSLDILKGSFPGAAAKAFAGWGMRYEELEALVAYRKRANQTADDLAVKATRSGDLWTTARATNVESDWLEFEQAAGPQTEHFSDEAIIGFLPSTDASNAISLAQLCGDIYGQLRSLMG